MTDPVLAKMLTVEGTQLQRDIERLKETNQSKRQIIGGLAFSFLGTPLVGLYLWLSVRALTGIEVLALAALATTFISWAIFSSIRQRVLWRRIQAQARRLNSCGAVFHVKDAFPGGKYLDIALSPQLEATNPLPLATISLNDLRRHLDF